MGVPVKELINGEQAERFSLRIIAGEKGFAREVTTSRIQKPGLLLTGLLEELHSDRLQIFGAAEINYLKRLEEDELEAILKVFKPELSAIIVTRDLEPPAFLVDLCMNRNIPLFRTPHTSSVLIELVTKYLEERLAPSTTLHGVLVDVLGVGVLIIGKSGIGKSECALDLVARGYRLVSDDVVIVKRMPPSILFGTSSELIKYHMEIRGLGILNIKDLYGITAIRERKQMDIVVELVKWESETEYDRLGFEENTFNILGVELPYLKVPVSPGRSVATIVEVAARNQILKIMGHHPAKALERELDNAMKGFKH
ncbi:MAG: HPr(Ser) kinase/phosphatase [Deltaproteobacteria bacterium RIFCSPLOWO2_02_FULL_55_12]|nr:MAG: HPr(Ser) kinase/phosphatase [Deltaproteobacteria bacterium RIFCSPLOWO2_02_FULL_55_12]